MSAVNLTVITFKLNAVSNSNILKYWKQENSSQWQQGKCNKHSEE